VGLNNFSPLLGTKHNLECTTGNMSSILELNEVLSYQSLFVQFCHYFGKEIHIPLWKSQLLNFKVALLQHMLAS
jgi:hypothetical protein